jgi:hypothetical protein
LLKKKLQCQPSPVQPIDSIVAIRLAVVAFFAAIALLIGFGHGIFLSIAFREAPQVLMRLAENNKVNKKAPNRCFFD